MALAAVAPRPFLPPSAPNEASEAAACALARVRAAASLIIGVAALSRNGLTSSSSQGSEGERKRSCTDGFMVATQSHTLPKIRIYWSKLPRLRVVVVSDSQCTLALSAPQRSEMREK